MPSFVMLFKPKYRFMLVSGVVSASVFLVANVSIWAQVPTQANPGVLLPAPTVQVRQEQQQTQSKSLPSTQNTPEKTTLDRPDDLSSVAIPEVRFYLDKLMVEGSTLLSSKDLEALMAPYEKREVTFDDLNQAAAKLRAYYHDKGYFTTYVFIPPQDVDDGILRIKVLEGRLGKLSVDKNRYYRDFVVTRQFRAKAGQLFNYKTFEEDINLANQLAPYQVKAVLNKGEHSGETDITLNVVDKQPWQISLTGDNQGRPFIGMYRGGVDVTNQSLLGLGDRLFTRYYGASGTQVVMGSYSVPVNRFGDEVSVNYSYSHVDVDLGLNVPQQPIVGTAKSYGIAYSHPLNKKRSLVSDIGLNLRTIDSRVDSTRVSHDEIRTLQAGISFNESDRLGRTSGRLQQTVGIGFLGGNRQFFKSEAMVTRLLRLSESNTLILKGYGQLTPDALPTAEAFQIGGAYSVRGYTEGLLIADRGFSFSAEDRFPIPFLSRISPKMNNRLQGAAFFDVGRVWLDSSNSRFGAASNQAKNSLLMSVGVGVRARLTRFVQGFADLGVGLGDRNGVTRPNGDPTVRLHFGLRSNLLPE